MTQDRSAAGEWPARGAASPDDALPPGGAAGSSRGGQGSRRAGAGSAPVASAAAPSGSSAPAPRGAGAGRSAADDPPTDVLARVGGRRGRSGSTGAVTDGAPEGTAGSGAAARTGRAEARATASPRAAGQRRRARLGLVRVDPWSVFVLSLLISIFLGIVLLVAVVALYSLLSTLGVLDSLDTFARDLQVIKEGQSIIGFGRVLGIAAVVAAVDVVLLTVLATLAAFLYNVCARFTGGVEVVLAERD